MSTSPTGDLAADLAAELVVPAAPAPAAPAAAPGAAPGAAPAAARAAAPLPVALVRSARTTPALSVLFTPLHWSRPTLTLTGRSLAVALGPWRAELTA